MRLTPAACRVSMTRSAPVRAMSLLLLRPRTLPAALFEASEELHQVAAQIVAEIAAFLDQHRRQAKARDLPCHGMEARACDLQALQWIALAGIEPERHDQRAGCEFTDTRQRLVAGCEPRRVGRTERLRQVEVVAGPGALAGLVGVTPEIGIVVGRIGVDRDREHVGAPVEDALRAVAVMDIDVEHGDAFVLAAQALRG